MRKLFFLIVAACLLVTDVIAQKKDTIAYGLNLDEVQIVARRIRHANEANAGRVFFLRGDQTKIFSNLTHLRFFQFADREQALRNLLILRVWAREHYLQPLSVEEVLRKPGSTGMESTSRRRCPECLTFRSSLSSLPTT